MPVCRCSYFAMPLALSAGKNESRIAASRRKGFAIDDNNAMLKREMFTPWPNPLQLNKLNLNA